jgi:hypothetical protein
MTSPADLLRTLETNVTQLASRWPQAEQQLLLFAVDGYPSHTPGASDPSAPLPKTPSGPCRESVPCWNCGGNGQRLVAMWVDGEERMVAEDCPTCLAGLLKLVPCTHERPCIDHDGAHLTSVEATVVARARTTDDHDAIVKALVTANNALTAAHRIVDRNIPREKPAKCNRGVGRENYMRWHDPLCENYPDPNCQGMCVDCWQLEDNDRKEHGLERRAKGSTPYCKVAECDHEATAGRSDGLCDMHRKRISRQKGAAA